MGRFRVTCRRELYLRIHMQMYYCAHFNHSVEDISMIHPQPIISTYCSSPAEQKQILVSDKNKKKDESKKKRKRKQILVNLLTMQKLNHDWCGKKVDLLQHMSILQVATNKCRDMTSWEDGIGSNLFIYLIKALYLSQNYTNTNAIHSILFNQSLGFIPWNQ